MSADFDFCIIGGGINGVGIAREAAARGYSVLLVEAQDLAQATSWRSTKLIHGGLRYLEGMHFGLVRESLKERDALLEIAPHLVHKVDFVLPHVPEVRNPWKVRTGLFLYDHLAGRSHKLPKSQSLLLKETLRGDPLKVDYVEAIQYTDCRVDDSRLVVLTAVDARARRADILTRTLCLRLAPSAGKEFWDILLKDLWTGDEFQVTARYAVNASGSWVRALLESSELSGPQTPQLRLVKGSHMVFPRFYEGDHAYALQQPDRRLVFVIPYEKDFTLVGTTDIPFEGDPSNPVIDEEEKRYLCTAVNRFFKAQIGPSDAIWTYSGIRSLFDDGRGKAQDVTREYALALDLSHGPALLSVFGGKMTTYRHLAQQAVDKITRTERSKKRAGVGHAPLPGGDIYGADFPAFLEEKKTYYAFLPPALVERYANAYGTRIDWLLDGVDALKSLGRDFGSGLYEKEIFYLIRHEFARTAEDILWRRTKIGLVAEKKTVLALEAAMPDYLRACATNAVSEFVRPAPSD